MISDNIVFGGGYIHYEEDVWLDMETYKLDRIDRLKPTDWPLEFNKHFMYEVATNSTVENFGVYCMGWEL